MILNVLIVEDNFIIQMFLENSIEEMGHIIVGTESSSEEALSIIDHNDLDLILMDWTIRRQKRDRTSSVKLKLKWRIRQSMILL